jgi:hypothetical protein
MANRALVPEDHVVLPVNVNTIAAPAGTVIVATESVTAPLAVYEVPGVAVEEAALKAVAEYAAPASSTVVDLLINAFRAAF